MRFFRKIMSALFNDDHTPGLYSGLVVGAHYGRRDSRN
jgi:hypothetical protein